MRLFKDKKVTDNMPMSQNNAQQINEFFGKYKLKHFKKGEYLMRAGSEPEGIYSLTQGVVRQVVTTKKGEELTVNTYHPPAFIPLTWALDDIANKYDYIAFTDVDAYVAPAKETTEFLKSNPEVLFDLTKRLLSGLNGLLVKTEHLMDHSAQERLVLTLLQLAYRYGSSESGTKQVQIHLLLTHRELATFSGLSRETVSNEMKSLSNGGYITNEHRTVVIADLTQLEELL